MVETTRDISEIFQITEGILKCTHNNSRNVYSIINFSRKNIERRALFQR